MIYLTIATLFWGTTFLVQRTAVPFIDAFFYNGLRFFVGGIILFLIPLINRHPFTKLELRRGFVLGLVLAISINLQQLGIETTTAGKAGFITSLYLLFVPLILLFFGHRIRLIELIALFISLYGFYLLSDFKLSSTNTGDVLVLICAIWFALHVLLVSRYSKQHNPFSLSALQFLTCGIISLGCAHFRGAISLAPIINTWFELFYGCLFSVVIAYTLQMLGQKKTSPTIASFIMSLEGVVALIAGMIILNEQYISSQLVGAAPILLATITTIIPWKYLLRK